MNRVVTYAGAFHVFNLATSSLLSFLAGRWGAGLVALGAAMYIAAVLGKISTGRWS